MTEEAHSKLFAPSSAHRWMRCSASSEAASRYVDQPGEAAMEGTAAHFLLEKCLVEGSSPHDFLGRTIAVTQDRCTREFVVSKQMANDVLHCGVEPVRHIVSLPGTSRVESKVGLPHIHKELRGTADVWHFSPVSGWMHIFDYKYGRLDVSPDTEQLKIYALSVYHEFVKPLAGENVAGVRLMIGQPRSLTPGPRVKHWDCTLTDLQDFELQLRVAVNDVLHHPKFTVGEWCKYCPALGSCPATVALAVSLGPVLAAGDMGPDDAAKILAAKDLLETKIKQAQRVAMDALMKGQKVPGWFVATGTKHRQWRDEDMARDALVDAVGVGALKPPTPSQAEALGADAKSVVTRLAFTPPGEPTLARVGDKRAPYVAKSAAEMLGG